MDRYKIRSLIPTLFFSAGILTLLILSNSNSIAYGQGQNQINLDDNNSIKYKYNAKLTGGEQVPPVKTEGIGTASFELLNDNKTLHYQVNILDVPEITGIHIHKAKLSENGDILVDIYNTKENIFKNQNTTKISEIESSSITINGNNQNSFATSGTINNLDLQGPLKGKNIFDLIALIENGDTYVNVHSKSNPDGEIRAQIT
ncbi:MAG: CHRD domain-containing protein [Nitrososphaerales archaeon]